MPRALRHILVLTFAAFFAAGVGAAQAADRPFSVRHAATLHGGDILAVGNTSLSCPDVDPACAGARARSVAHDNDDFAMAYVDIDGDGTTFDSSSATVDVPAGSTISWAGLYWSGDTSAGAGGSAAPDANAAGQVRVKTTGGYQTVNAGELLTATADANRYRAFADITSLLAASGTQTLTVADVQAGTGTGRFGGWGLIVAYGDPTKAYRRVNVYDGLLTVQTGQSLSSSIGPFQAPSTGTPYGKIGLVGFDGDEKVANETATFNGFSAADGLNPINNVMNSTITSNGAHLTAKNPDYRNTARRRHRLGRRRRRDHRQPDRGDHGPLLDHGPVPAGRDLPGLRRGPGAQHGGSRSVGHRPRRSHAQLDDRHVVRHADGDLRPPVAALRRRRRGLCRRPWGDRRHVPADRRRRGLPHARAGRRHQRRRRPPAAAPR